MSSPSRLWNKLRNRRKTIYISPIKRINLLKDSAKDFRKPDEELNQYLGKITVSGDYPNSIKKPIIFFSCDHVYFDKFGIDLAQSIRSNSPSCHIHIHLYSPPGDTLARAFTLSEEMHPHLTYTYDMEQVPYTDGEMARFYYASVRCIYLSLLAEHVSVPILSIDADAVVRKDIASMIEPAREADVGLFERPRKRRVWRRVAAGAILINPTPEGRRFIREIAATTARFILRAPDFHIDQLTIYYALRMRRFLKRPFRVWQIPKSLIDWDFSPDSVIWSAKGANRKITLLTTLGEAEAAPTSPPHLP